MRKLYFLFAIFVIFSASLQAQNQITVANDTVTSGTIPVWGEQSNSYLHSQVIYPASMLTDMTGRFITAITFYLDNNPSWTSTFKVGLKVVNENSFASTYISANIPTLYSGAFTVSNGNTLTIQLNTPFAYTGGNLLLDISTSSPGDYDYSIPYPHFYGINSSGSSICGFRYGHQQNIEQFFVEDFIPKTTFTFSDACSPANLTVSNITGNSAFVTWTENPSGAGQHYQLSYKLDGAASWTNYPGNITGDHQLLSGLIPDTLYQLRLRANCGGSYSDYLTTSFATTCIGGEDVQTVTVGNGTSTVYGEEIPLSTGYDYSYTQQIYTAAEIGSAGTIRQLDVQYIAHISMIRNVDIYLGHTTANTFASGNDYVPADNLTLVYSGELFLSNTGENYWVSIPFTTPFDYNGTDNLVVVFDDNTGYSYYWGEKFYMHECNDNRSICFVSYNGDLLPANPINSSSYSYPANWRMNARFTTTSCSSDGCDRGNVAAVNITGSSAQLLFVPGAGSSNFEIQYAANGSTFTTVNATTSPYLLTGLMQNTEYTVRIRSNCGTGWSEWKAIQFTTKTNNYTRLYVKANGTGDGASWAAACSDLNWALSTAALIKEATGTAPDIWVAQGVYYGDTNTSNAFTMVSGVNVYGGFVGNEPANYNLTQRDFAAHPTILDGQNLRRVLYQPSGFATVTIWDGFTVRNGAANANYPNGNGGGAWLRENSVFRNCRFTHNTANDYGGGAYAGNIGPGGWDDTAPISTLFENCEFTHNTAYEEGGGLYSQFAVARHCVFTHNYAMYSGGGVYMTFYVNMSNNAAISNCLVANNTVESGGSGGIYLYAYNYGGTIENTTVVNNNGGGIDASNLHKIANCIVWGNRDGDNMILSSNETNGSSCVYTAVEDGYPGEGNIPLLSESIQNGLFAPKFVHPSATAGHTDSTENVDWHLQQGSVCVNRGSNSLVTIASNTDLDGVARVRHGQVDLGCYESDYDAITLPTFGDILYVTQTGAGTHDGSSWANAMDDLSLAIVFAGLSGGDVWVAEGVYYGDTSSTNAFTMMNGVNVYGGFVGNEPANYDLTQRDFTAHPTILDGQNARRVVYQPADFTTETIWDGFTVRNGLSNDNGGGAWLHGNAIFRHCRFTNNSTYYYGGGVYASSSNYNIPILIDDCEFTHNTASSGSGGGLGGNYAVIRHCVFTHNFASANGGGIYIMNALSDQATVSNCLVANNTAAYGGGIYFNTSNTLVENSTVVNNMATSNGGGICGYYSFNVTNSIVWGNHCNGNVSNVGTTNTYYTPNCVYSAVEGGFAGEGNIALESENTQGGNYSPMFVHPSLEVGYTDTTSNADWHLMDGSICVNRGNDSLVTIPSNTDLDGVARIRHGQVDFGCYESDYEASAVTPIGHIIYVTQTGAGEFDGSSWANALNDIPTAIATAQAHSAVYVWVAEGVYYGDTTASNAFTMVDGVSVYGGFAGDEPSNFDLSQRNFTAHPTILDGQNARRVISQTSDFTTATVWDGFTVRNGQASGNGGGASLQGNAVIRNCRFTHNTASISGGGVYAYFSNSYNSQPTLFENCEFTHNTASSYGGGLYSHYAETRQCVFTHNHASYYGGGIYLSNCLSYRSAVSNCLVANNTSNYGGGIYSNTSYAIIENSTVVNNSANNGGGGLYSNFKLVSNSILWGNRCNGNLSNIQTYSTNPCIYSAIEGGFDGEGNITLLPEFVQDGLYSPKFVAPSLTAGYTDSTANTDWHLLEGSPCVNRGKDSLVTIASNTDLDGGQRIRHGQVDLGCYESDYDAVTLPELPSNGIIIYVTQTGAGNRSGGSWSNALDDLAAAVALAKIYGADVWVAEGVYYGDTTSSDAFTLVEGVDVYGGFAGNESADYDLSQRNFTVHPTILDGQNTRRVINQPTDFGAVTVWDGFTVRNGNTNGNGGGAWLRGNVVFRNSRFTNNTSSNFGGGVYAYNTNYSTRSITLEHCEFTHNTAYYYGGGLFNVYAQAQHCIFTHNRTYNSGGGVYVQNALATKAAVSNCLVANNTSSNGGGIYTNSGTVVLENVTVVNNSATSNGAGIYVSSIKKVINSILYGNRCNGNVSNLDNHSSTNTTPCIYSAVEGGFLGEGNIALQPETVLNGILYPKFVYPSLTVGYTDSTANADWHLQEGSVCVNRGSDSLVTIASNTDLDGGERIRHGQVDLGCYESDYDGIVLPTIGNILYVTQTGAGNHSGTSWENAMNDIQAATAIARNNGADVWVAEGVYFGDTTAANAFTMQDGVNVYGGFAGDESIYYDLSQRDFTAHPTILDGQNTRRVLHQAANFTTETVWDGFTLRNGYANGDGGGALLLGNAVLRYCRFTHNTATGNGGGLYGNLAVARHCIFTHNYANYGGGVYIANAQMAKTAVSNCLVANNTANYGGGIHSNATYAIVENTTVVNNEAIHNGGGLYSHYINKVTNSILWGNRNNGNVSNLINYDPNNRATCVYTAIEGGYPGEGNVLLMSATFLDGLFHPKFVHPSHSVGYADTTANADWHLLEGSVCVNRGNNALVTISPNNDLDGETRVRHGNVDLGCYESDYDGIALPQIDSIVYVTQTGAGLHDGSSWENALGDLLMADTLAGMFGADIWVAEGIYYGDTTADNAFTMREGVNVYGGFAGNEPANYDLSLRNFAAHPTILDGMGTRRVLYQPNGFTQETVWDGFTIQNGFTTNMPGGGGASLSANSVLRNCIVTGNQSSTQGGGVYAQNSSIENCTISHNATTSSYGYGGGLYLSNSTVSNCLVANNTATSSGAGICASYSQIHNSTIVRNENTSQNSGAGIQVNFTSSQVTNCILWGNVSTKGPSNFSGSAAVTWSAVEGGLPGEGNIALLPESFNGGMFYPHFANPSATAGASDATPSTDWHLQSGSPCVNNGNNAFAGSHDLDGGLRVRQGTVDMGCYESDFTGNTMPQYGNILYVTEQGSGDGSGSSWDNATASLHYALILAHTADADIWVAEGVYYGDTSATNAFTMIDSVNVYGGFAGNEPESYDLALRDFNAHPSILDGQNMRRVLYQPANFFTETEWNGFIVRNGNATDNGGGAWLRDNAVVRNSKFTHNNATNNGGGVYTEGYNSAVLLEKCEFTHNHSRNGGGMNITKATISNCLVANNTADLSGGGIYSSSSSAIVANTTVVNNTANVSGAGIYSHYINKVSNSILWGNRSNGNVSNLSDNSSNTSICVYTAIEGGYPGEGNIPLMSSTLMDGLFYPKFVHPSLVAGYTDTTATADWHLMEGSVCVNRGNDSLVTITSNTDLDGGERIRHGQVDLGCYESDYDGISLPQIDNIVYVTPTGAGLRDGSSWENALGDIQSADTVARMYGADVWVAEGVYYGDTTAANAYTMMEGIHLYGGFAGNEPADFDLSLRNFAAHPTILDGMGVRRVLYQPNAFQQETVWDGFTIRNGHTASYSYGGGAYLLAQSLLRNCTFTGNQSGYYGGGAYARNSTLSNCVISHNTSSSNGGGLYAENSTVSNCIISHNTGTSGGGLLLTGSTMSNCLVANNTSANGAGISSHNSQINNSTIVRNTCISSNNGAGLRSSNNTTQVTNSILWGNLSLGEEDNVYGVAAITWSAVEGGYPGEGNIALLSESYNNGMFYPHFVNPSAVAGASDTTQNADWHLQSESPCINNGNNALAGSHDLDGGERVRQGTVDMGCYESDFTGNPLPQYGNILYVTEQGAGDFSGSSWSNAAASLQHAIILAYAAGADVWVATGTYYGDGASANAFTMREGVNVYGGFAGNEPESYDLNLRDFNAHPSILDGQHQQRVLCQTTDFTSTKHTVWDGFTIQNGTTNEDGAGVYLRKHTTLSHCIVQNNMAVYNYASANMHNQQRQGAGIYVNSNNEFVNSTSVFTTFIHHCTIRNNSFEYNPYLSGYGAGLAANNVKVSHTEISHNTLGYKGGGVRISGNSDFSNCLIHNNSSTNGGGLSLYGSSHFVNCDIVNNLCSDYGGGVDQDHSGTAVFTNCIIWGNKKNFLADNTNGSCTFSHCAMEEAQTGAGNLTLAAPNDGTDQTLYYVRFMDPANGNFQLHPSSSCVNNGTNEAVTDSLDFYGLPRIHQTSVDIGCSESSDESQCASVMNLVADNITTNSARLSWHATGNESQWLVVYGIEGGESTSVTVSDTLCQLTGLMFNRNYTAKVRAICGDGMMSVFSISVNFQTTCDPTVLDTLPNFSQLAPTDSVLVYDQQVSFSWAAMSNATSYDFYIWADGYSEPATPTVSGLTLAGISDYTLVGYTRGKFYHWKVVAWNECISKSSPVMTFRVNPLPDLHVSSVDYSNPVASQEMTVTWTVTNDGEGSTPPGETWNDYIWLSPVDGIGNGFWYDVAEVKLATVPNLSSLEAGQSYQNSATVTIPNDFIGSYYLFVLSNQSAVVNIDYTPTGQTTAPDPYTPSADGNPYPYLSGGVYFNTEYMEEVNKNDNFFYKVISILPPPAPDLVVSSIVHGGDAISGGNANVTWTVTNQGEASAMGTWRDVVYLSSDTLLDTEADLRVGRFDHAGPLAAGESYQQTANFTIPVDYMGDYYFFVITDNNNSVYESLGEFNNMEMSTPIAVTFTWLTDLVVTGMNLPATVSPNQSFTMDYTVTNIGSSPTSVSYWYDRIYISADPVFDPATAVEFSGGQHYNVLNADASYTNSCNIHIPDTLTGTLYWFVVVDEHNYVFEYNAKVNNVYTHTQSTTVLLPDLQVSGIEIPGTVNPNENAVVRWTVRNNGPGDLVHRFFTDQFTFNGEPFYTANANGITLAAGDTLVRMANIPLPCVSGNTAAFAILTDAEQQVIENNEGNNTKTVPVSIITPDLAVSDLTIPVGTAWSGTTANLSYKITNNGSVTASNPQVTDKIYLSTSADNWQESDLIGSYTHALSLAPQAYATYSCSVTLPNGISGTYYYHMVCNADTAFCESGSMSNNTANSGAVAVNLSPSPDLVITEVTVPSNVYLGADFELSYTIKNQGNAALSNANVQQKFYYSTSPIHYDTTKRLLSVNDHLTLGVNGSVTKTTLAHLPVNAVPTLYYIHAVTDAGNVVYEHNTEENNTKVSDGMVASVYQLDMQLVEIQGPDVVQWGQSATYRLHVVNGTSLPTLASAWSDVLYWSENPVLHSTDLLQHSEPHNIQMDANGDYWVEMPVTIPYGAPANVYLIGITDYGNANPDINLSNNVLTKVLTVQSVPTPDLAVVEVVVLDSVISGQPARIAYKVTNVGDIPMDNLTWNDKLFLSANSTYESGDIQLVTQDRSAMTLVPGASYRDTLTFTVPLPNNGDLYLLMIANAANSPYEANWSNNIAAVNVAVALTPPGDLIVSDVTCESTIVSGQMLHASWTIQNIGENPLSGDGLRSLVYVSTDTVFDATDRLLGSVTNSINLPIDQMMQQSVTGKISGVRPGEYYLIVKTDVTNAFNEADDNNNTGHSVMPFTVTIRPLPFNTDVAETLVNNEISDFLLEVGDNVSQTVRIRLTSSDSLVGAMNVIYVTYNDIGDNFNYTYSTIGQFTANSVLYIPATEPGYYGVSLSGSTPSGTTQNVVIRADILPFELHAVNADHGGNTGKVTVELTGSRFRPGMIVSLRNNDEEIIADSLTYVNYYQCFATFDLTNRTPGGV